jgi:hypothetical protein
MRARAVATDFAVEPPRAPTLAGSIEGDGG